MKRRSLVRSLAGSLVAAQLGARAAEFSPSRPIMLVLPFAPGGSTDAVARALADALRARLGQQVVIDNKPGAGGAIANEFVARAAPDGHTLLLAGSSLTMNPALSKVGYDPVKSFTPLSQVLELEIFLVTRPDIPARSLQELIAYAKARPGILSYASVGNGSVTHFQMELLKAMAGLHIVHIPYRGSSPAMTDFIGGQVDLMFDGLATSGPYIRNGKARALAVAAPTRSRALPEVPTVPEAGLPGYEATAWTGLLGPANLPAPVVERLNREIVAATQEPVFQQRVELIGGRVASSTPQAYSDRIAKETLKWARLAQERGMRTA